MHPDYTIRVPRSNPTAMPFSMIIMQLHINNNPATCRLSGNQSGTGQAPYATHRKNPCRPTPTGRLAISTPDT